MKTLVIVVLLTVICFLHHNYANNVGSLFEVGCCEGVNKTRVPKDRIKHIGKTPDHCKIKAYVITTVCNKKLCIDAKWKVGQSMMAVFKKRGPSSASFDCKN